MMTYGDIDLKLEKDITILNIVTKFHKIVTKITGLREQTPSKIVNFHEQSEITYEGNVQYYTITDFNEVDMRIYLPARPR